MSFVSGPIAASKASSSSEAATKASVYAQLKANTLAKRQYQETKDAFQPYADVGKRAIPTYEKMLNGGYDMKESPAAQYQLTQGTKALNRALAARGLSGSGNAVNRLTELNSSIAASDWNNQYARILDALKLGTGASSSMGSASNANAQASQNTANNLSNIYQTQGNNQASLYSGLGGQTANAAALGLKAYQAYTAGAAGAAAGAATDAAIGTGVDALGSYTMGGSAADLASYFVL